MIDVIGARAPGNGVQHHIATRERSSPSAAFRRKISLDDIRVYLPPTLNSGSGPSTVNCSPESASGRYKAHPIEIRELIAIVFSMAVQGYCYEVEAKRSGAPKEIRCDLEKHGLKLDEDTVRHWLQQGREQYAILRISGQGGGALAGQHKRANPKSIQSLLKLLLGMGIEVYSYDPGGIDSNAAGVILNDVVSLGFALDLERISYWLNEAREQFTVELPNGRRFV
jgi:hypothetical protein